MEDNPLKGKEVSCRALGFFFEEFLKKGVPIEKFAEWSGYPLEHLSDKNERIDWVSFGRLMSHIGKIWSDEEMEEMGKRFMTHSWIKPLTYIARLLYTPEEMLEWTVNPNAGVGRQFFGYTHNASIRKVKPNRFEMRITMRGEYEPVREFFFVSKGAHIAMPNALGLPDAEIEMREIEGGYLYDILLPSGGGSLAWLRKAITRPLALSRREPKDEHELLKNQPQNHGVEVNHKVKDEDLKRQSSIEGRDDNPFKGKEVSCRPLGVLLDELPKKGIPPQSLADWSGYPLKHLRNKKERIDWQSFVKLMSMVGTKLTEEELVELGYGFSRSTRWIKPINLVGRLLFTPKEFIQWANQPGKGFGNQFFTCIIPSVRDIGPNRVEMKFQMRERYEPSREFALVVKGSFITLPNLFYLDNAEIEMKEIGGGYLYDIRLPPGGGSFSWLRRAVTSPFAARATATELKESLALLHERYGQLEREMAERRRIEDALRDSEEKFKNLAEESPNMIFILKDERIVYINRRCEEIPGFTKEEIYSEDFDMMTLVAPESMDLAKENFKRVVNGLEIPSSEIKILSKSGRGIDTIVNTTIIDYEGEKAVLGILTDITDRKEAEKAFRESERRYRNLFNMTLDGVYRSDAKGVFTQINQAGAEIFGHSSPEDMVGKRAVDYWMNPELRNVFISKLKRKKSISAFPIHAKKQDGEELFLETSSRILEDSEGTFMGIEGILRDVTDQKRAAEEMKRQLMKFILDEGKLYLVNESTRALSHEAFRDLLKVGFKGIVISRTPEKEFRGYFEGDYNYVWMAESGKRRLGLDELEEMFDGLPNRYAILLERLDYLIFKKGFDRTLSFVHYLRDLAHLGGHVVIISVDPQTLDKKELRLIESETNEVEPRVKGSLPADQLDVLRVVHSQNLRGVKPSYTDVGREIGMSKPTVGKKVRFLKNAEYVFVDQKGQRKVLTLTKKGRNLFVK
jgi:PAS domain S-box-containing protein